MIFQRKEMMYFFFGVAVGALAMCLYVLNDSSVCGFYATKSPVASTKCPACDTAPILNDVIRQNTDTSKTTPRKFLLDCGANVASTVELFKNTYPGARNFTIHSFEIDQRLAPYFSPYKGHVMHCPEGVSGKDGTMTAYTESAWSPTRGLNNGRDMQWGGGSLFAFEDEKKDSQTGGKRKLALRPTIPTVDLSRWIRENTRKEDYVIFKLDVEGAEYDILKKMLDEGTFEWIDKYYGEFHSWQPVTGWTKKEKEDMGSKFKKNAHKIGVKMIDWGAENRGYKDFNELHPVKVPSNTPGIAGNVYSTCGTKKVAITVAIGMNLKRAHKIISILNAYQIKLPITLFIYGDFAELNSKEVKSWSDRFDIGVREDGRYPLGHFELMKTPWIRESLINAEMRLQESDIQPSFYLPVNSSVANIRNEAKSRGFRLVQPVVNFPPKEGTVLDYDNYYKFRDVERIPKALRILNDRLVASNGGILNLDTDLPDTRMNLVFLLDFLVENSGFELVSVADCIASVGNL